jgi:hypothetical protein
MGPALARAAVSHNARADAACTRQYASRTRVVQAPRVLFVNGLTKRHELDQPRNCLSIDSGGGTFPYTRRTRVALDLSSRRGGVHHPNRLPFLWEVALNDVDLDLLALLVDDRVLGLPIGCDPARLFGVRLRDDGVALVPFWSGIARGIPHRLVPPDGCVGIALESCGWAAPLDETVSPIRPSQHRERRRMHQTALVYGPIGADVTILRVEDDPPQVMRGAVGAVVDLLRSCWANRRPEPDPVL